MEIDDLQIIQALVSDPNLTRTAQRLGLTQSNLSKKVKAIEEEVKTPLFERRGPRGLKPFQAAIEFAQLSEKMLSTWSSGIRRIKEKVSEPELFVLVGPQLFLRDIVLPWWNGVQKDFPNLQFEMRVSALSRVSIETIQAGADAGVLEHKEELADFVCRPIYTERWGVVRNPEVHFDDLKKYAWGTYSYRDNPVDTWLVQRKKMPAPHYRLVWGDLTGLGQWVSENPGTASVLPAHTVATLVKAGKVVFEPIGPEATTKLYLAYQRNNPNLKFIRALSKMSEGALG